MLLLEATWEENLMRSLRTIPFLIALTVLAAGCGNSLSEVVGGDANGAAEPTPWVEDDDDDADDVDDPDDVDDVDDDELEDDCDDEDDVDDDDDAGDPADPTDPTTP